MFNKYKLTQNIEHCTHVEDINELVTKSKGPKHGHCNNGKKNEKRLTRKIISIQRKSVDVVASLTTQNKSVARRSVTLRVTLNELRLMHAN